MIKHDFSGKVALITGGTSGIGLATAHAFVDAGARVVLASRSEAAGQGACEVFGRERALFVRTDVRVEASVQNLVERALEHCGRLDVAFNCAGIGGDMTDVEHTNQDVWDDVMAVNARGVWLSMRYEIPALLAAGGGAIVNMSSIYGLAGKAAYHAYTTSKHAVLGMTRSVALEYASRGIRVNALCAGVTATATLREAQLAAPQLVQQLIAEHPMQRMASEAEVANAVLWLCSPAASFVTGTPLAMDGGFLAA